MFNNKHSKNVWLKTISLILIQAFLFTNISFAAGNLITSPDNSYLAPTINIQNGAISTTFINAVNGNPGSLGNRVTSVVPAATGLSTKDLYVKELERLESEKYIKSFTEDDKNKFLFEPSEPQLQEYLDAIKAVLAERGEKVITPDILFAAADRALKGKKSTIEARIALQPGTMNPLHYGHMSASLAAILGKVTDADKGKNVKVMTLLANGGTVPDKPFAASADIRNEMARQACSVDNDPAFSQWAQVTPIRGQMVDMFTASDETLKLAGANESTRRFNMDMAAFIWLFVANPKMEWIFSVGSDKVAEYGKKQEYGLLVETLSREEAHAKVVYFEREGEEIDVANDIKEENKVKAGKEKEWEWLSDLWDDGFFTPSAVLSFADLSATKIRKALINNQNFIISKVVVNGKEQEVRVPLTESMAPAVIDYIRSNKTLMFLYRTEMGLKDAKDDLDAGNAQDALLKFSQILKNIEAELEKPDGQGALSRSELKNLKLLVLANEIEQLTKANILKGINEIFLIYSAAPGTGKGELMDATFEKGKGKYSNLIGKLILYHTRDSRVKNGKAEKDGIKYHFRTEAQLKSLEAQEKIVTAWVNKQLQGMAKEDFVEEGIKIQKVNGAEQLKPGDIIKSIKKNSNGEIESISISGADTPLTGVNIPLDSMYDLLEGDIIRAVDGTDITIARPVKGMSAILDEGKPVILEGGYGWFKSLVAQNPEIVSMFIAPFADSDITVRAKNTNWINENFKTAEEKVIAYQQVQLLIEENKGEIDLTADNDQSEGFRNRISGVIDSYNNALSNADIIESDQFIIKVNALLAKIKGNPISDTEHDLVRSLAYEIDRRLSDRDGYLNFSSNQDRYNRVVEGVVQVLRGSEYSARGTRGKVLVNAWAYNPAGREEKLAQTTDEFARFFFTNILDGVRRKIALLGHQIKAPPAAEEVIKEVTSLSAAQIDDLSTDELAEYVERLTQTGALKAIPDLQEIFFLFSGAPGTGKDTVAGETLTSKKVNGVKIPGKYNHLVDKLLLYHTRGHRPHEGEKDGANYHFRSAEKLEKLEQEGKIMMTLVNNQEQGMAIDDFLEDGIEVQLNGGNQLMPGDKIISIERDSQGKITNIKIIRNGQEVLISNITIDPKIKYDLYAGDIVESIESDTKIFVKRQIRGMKNVISSGKPVVLEGGYGWFKEFTKLFPEIVTLFIAPFSVEDNEMRVNNSKWISDNTSSITEQVAAYAEVQKLITENQGEIDITANTDAAEKMRVQLGSVIKNASIRAFNASLIESDGFITDLNKLLVELFGNAPVRSDQHDLIRAMAYEVNRRLASRDSVMKFSREKGKNYSAGETDPENDQYNRVLEGIVQILYREEYSKNRPTGKIVYNPWGYTPQAFKSNIANLTNDFTEFFFTNIVNAAMSKLHPNTDGFNSTGLSKEAVEMIAGAI